jgi:hypothetical protein
MRALRRIAPYVGVGLLCLAMVVGRVVHSSRALWQAGTASLAEGQAGQAVVFFGRAARMYAPGNPYAARALAALMEQGRGAEGRGDRALALQAYREARSAVLSTRGLYTPNRDVLSRANERLAELMAAEEGADPQLAREPLAARRAWHARALARDEMPKVGWTLLALLGVALLIGGAVRMIWTGVTPEGEVRWRQALRWGGVSLLGFALMALGLWLA